METFPEDVAIAERKTNGDPDIINSDEFQPQKKKKESWNDLFGDPIKKRKCKFIELSSLETKFLISYSKFFY